MACVPGVTGRARGAARICKVPGESPWAPGVKFMLESGCFITGVVSYWLRAAYLQHLLCLIPEAVWRIPPNMVCMATTHTCEWSCNHALDDLRDTCLMCNEPEMSCSCEARNAASLFTRVCLFLQTAITWICLGTAAGDPIHHAITVYHTLVSEEVHEVIVGFVRRGGNTLP